ncbi:Predicted dehydrogenase [Saccharopolyspora kobensis]|uniref:Predicted dehydrogenase n=1 Tax=Saccharopolyspora kobensis TaxID=146035 RepID=A0A1H6DRG4_9PSEU|nr:Gfo/Idh/MocA family oxidoreductase [Saccharopolyspora kobensis]SEG87820.1 Predicted dehydrogenase [Saccharopolyspora kobensis]SFE04859.1 Predicted dehydrogenase [Saccharopolyspora kobensis]
MSSALRVGLIGYGVGGAIFHAPLIAAHPSLRLAAVVTANPERQQQVRAEHPDTAVVGDVDSLLAGDLDLVVVASPNRTHVELATAALDAGLPVVVDKPFTPTAVAGRRLIEHAESKGLLLTVFQNRRWDNDVRTVAKLIDDGELGRVHRFESRFERWSPTPKPTWRDSGGAEDVAGILYDLGSHLIDQALRLFGPVAAVYAEIDRRRQGVRADDDSYLALTHVNGVRSHLWMSKVAAQPGPRFRVLGEKAAFTKYGLDPQEAELRAGRRPVDETWGREPEESWGVLGVGDDVRRVPSERGDYLAFYDGVVRSLRDGAPPPVDPADAVAALDIISAAHRSVAEITVERLL